MSFELGSCMIDEGGVISGFADTIGLQDLGNTMFENSPFSEFFDFLGDPGGSTEEGGV
jgi:hypothetical protein